jgi:hypothetical protein
MKKIILLLTIITFSYSCNSDDSNSNNDNPSNGNVDYYFKIKINGVEHKVQGNTSSFLNGDNPNFCYATIGTTTQLVFRIADITWPNYISGQTLFMQVSIPNCQVGLNQADLSYITSPVWDDFVQNSSAPSVMFVENSGLYYITNDYCQGPLLSQFIGKITINITDMGTPSGPQGYGNTFKGSYNGPIYYGTSSVNSGCGQINNMNIPMQFSMEFEAYRIN